MEEAWKLVVRMQEEASAAQKVACDQRKYPFVTVLGVSDVVLVKQTTFERKLQNRWEEALQVVCRQPNPSFPVYEVPPLEGRGHKQALHRNLLLPVP